MSRQKRISAFDIIALTERKIISRFAMVKSEDYVVTDSVSVHRTFHIILCTTKDTKASKMTGGEMPGLHTLVVYCFLFVSAFSSRPLA